MTITSQAASTYRDDEVAGLPSSGPHEPVKPEIRALFAVIDTAIGAIGLGGSVTIFKADRAALNADLAHNANTVALVYSDSTPENNDYYLKVGDSGTGSWTKLGLIVTPALASQIAELAAAYAEIDVTIGLAEAYAAAAQASAVQSNADQVVATTKAAEAAVSAANALAAANSTGPIMIYATKADANAALPGLSDGDWVEVQADESAAGKRVRYEVISGAFGTGLVMDPLTGVSIVATGTVSVGDGAHVSGTNNAIFGQIAAFQASINYTTAIGRGAAYQWTGDFNTFLGSGAGEGGFGNRNVAIGPISLRNAEGSDNYGIGFAALQNSDGDNRIGIGNHAGSPVHTDNMLDSPTADYLTNTIETDIPPRAGSPTIGKIYRVVFENGGGATPTITTGTLNAVSTIVECTAVAGGRVTWKLLSATMTDNGTNGWTVGLAYYHHDNVIMIGGVSSDGSGQVTLGYGDTREFLPPNNGLTSLGRSPYEAQSYGYTGPQIWRNASFRYCGVWGNLGEGAFIDYGHVPPGKTEAVRRFQTLLDASTATLAFQAFNDVGTPTLTTLTINNANGAVNTPHNFKAMMRAQADVVDMTGSTFQTLTFTIAGWSTKTGSAGINTTDGTITVNQDGTYLIAVTQGTAGSNVGQGSFAIAKNGTPLGIYGDLIGARNTVSITEVLDLLAGDVISVMVNPESTTLTLRNNAVGGLSVAMIA